MVKETFASLDSRVANDTNFFLKFPAEHSSLRKAVVDFQILVLTNGYAAMNVTAFCLPEMLACTFGKVLQSSKQVEQ